MWIVSVEGGRENFAFKQMPWFCYYHYTEKSLENQLFTWVMIQPKCAISARVWTVLLFHLLHMFGTSFLFFDVVSPKTVTSHFAMHQSEFWDIWIKRRQQLWGLFMLPALSVTFDQTAPTHSWWSSFTFLILNEWCITMRFIFKLCL